MDTNRSCDKGKVRITVGARLRSAVQRVSLVRLFLLALSLQIVGIVAVNLYGQDAPVTFYCPARTAHVLTVKALDWDPGLVVTTQSGGSAKLTPCNLPFSTVTLPADGAFAVDGWNALLTCGSRAAVRVVDIPVAEGSCIRYSTEAVFREGSAVVEVPELHDPLPQGSSVYFGGIRTEAPRSTFIALVAAGGGLTRAAVTVYDGFASNPQRAVVYVDGFTWYEVPSGLFIGSVDVENIGSGIDDGADLYAVAFAGYREGGSPRVIEGEVRR